MPPLRYGADLNDGSTDIPAAVVDGRSGRHKMPPLQYKILHQHCRGGFLSLPLFPITAAAWTYAQKGGLEGLPYGIYQGHRMIDIICFPAAS